MRIEPYKYYLGVFKCRYADVNTLKEKYDTILLALDAPSRYVFSIRQLIAIAHNYFETRYIKKWIRKPELRFLAFLLLETQIDKIIKKIDGEYDKVTIVISRGDLEVDLGCKSYSIRERSDKDLPYMRDLAMHRLRIEREKY